MMTIWNCVYQREESSMNERIYIIRKERVFKTIRGWENLMFGAEQGRKDIRKNYHGYIRGHLYEELI